MFIVSELQDQVVVLGRAHFVNLAPVFKAASSSEMFSVDC